MENNDCYNIVSKLIYKIDKALYYQQSQKYFNMNTEMNKLIIALKTFEDSVLCELPDFIDAYVIVVKEMFESYKKRDYVELSDVLQYQLKKFLCDVILELYEKEYVMAIDNHIYDEKLLHDTKKQLLGLIEKVEVSDEYILESTQVGAYTLHIKKGDKDFYMHSKYEPYLEAIHIADNIYHDIQNIEKYGMKKIVVFGLGLGYHIERLSEYRDIDEIVVIESDINILAITLNFVGLSCFTDSKVHIEYDPQLIKLKELMKNTKNVYMYQPAIENISKGKLKDIVKDYFLGVTARKSHMSKLVNNFNKNIVLNDACLYEIRENLDGKNIILLAGGPSLGECIPILRKLQDMENDKVVIMAVGTVYKMLKREGITPQYVIITDAQNTMSRQIKDVDTSGSSLIYLSTVDYNVPIAWKGKRYIIFQRDFEYSEYYIKEHKSNDVSEYHALVATGGSVATTAFDLALRYGADSIITMGLDLAYYKNQYYESKISGEVKLDESLIDMYVKANEGGKIPTCRNLNGYRKWIEKRISERKACEKNTRLINCSKGAVIAGMEYMTITQLVSETDLFK